MQSSDEQLRSRLLQAYEADPDRSKMGRLRKQYDTIIDLQKGGMSLEKILIVLNEDKKPDDCLTMKTFNGYLYLLRKERKGQMSLEVGSVTQEPSTPLKKSGKKKQLDTPAAPVQSDAGKRTSEEKGKNENLNETNPLRKLSGSRKPGEFNPIPTAKIEFD